MGFGGKTLFGIRSNDLNDFLWHHVAVCGDGKGITLFLNGHKSTRSHTPAEFNLKPSTSNVCIGAPLKQPPDDRFILDGDLAAFRISNKCLYQVNFEPPSRLNASANTVALFSFPSQESGTRITDRSRYGMEGYAAAPQWTRTDDQTPSSPPASPRKTPPARPPAKSAAASPPPCRSISSARAPISGDGA